MPAAAELGEVLGSVVDESGAVIAGARVKLVHIATGEKYETTTGASGNFRFPQLQSGEYAVSVQRAGFASQDRKVVVKPNSTSALNVTMRVVAMASSIDVTDMISVLFAVTDKKGRLITGLDKDDLVLKEDGKTQEIAHFAKQSALPLTIAILIDTSVSVKPVLQLEKQTAQQFLRAVLREQDLALIIQFNREVSLVQDFTADVEQLEVAIESMRIGDGTSLHDAVLFACNEKLASVGGRKAIVLISDGDDTTSLTKLKQAIDSAYRSDAIVYAISNQIQRTSLNGDGRTLRRYAENTGGKAFFLAKLDDIKQAFEAIQQELRGQYNLAYNSSNTRHDGRFRRIKILLRNHRDLRVRAKQGYYAPRSPSMPSPR
jgi:VWFA-related protein